MKSSFLLLLLTLFAFSACDKVTTQGEEKPVSDVRLVSKMTSYHNNTAMIFMEFSYDDQNRMTEAKSMLPGMEEMDFIEKNTWEYNGNTVTHNKYSVKGYDSNIWHINITTTFSLNVDGTVKSATWKRFIKHNEIVLDFIEGGPETYTYTDGFLTQYDRTINDISGDGSIEPIIQKQVFTWKDGNVMREDVIDDHGYVTYEYKGVYDKKCNIDIAFTTKPWAYMSIIPMNTGKRSQCLISKSTEFTVDGDVEERNFDYIYEYDSKGYIVKLNKMINSVSQIAIVITYAN